MHISPEDPREPISTKFGILIQNPKADLQKKLAWMIGSARGSDMPNLVEIGSRGSSGKMCVFGTIILFYIYTYKCKKTAVYTNVNGDIVSYTSKTAKIKKGDITQQHIAKCQCVVE